MAANQSTTPTPRWNCARCTFENESGNASCAICMHKRLGGGGSDIGGSSVARHAMTSSPVAPVSAMKAVSRSKPRASPLKSGDGKQSFPVLVGSSEDLEAKRLARKLQQLRDLGIDGSDDKLIPLLARNCYCVHVAASEYFENMTEQEADRVGAGGGAGDRCMAEAVAFFENDFLGAPFKLLGKKLLKASITRTGVTLAAGDRLLFQGENVGKKRRRPESAPSAFGFGCSPPTTTAATANGIVRVSTLDHTQLGRLEREMEIVLHPLVKEGLVSLGGVCQEPPASSDVFASFKVLVFVFVHPRAFDVFADDHPLFHLSDALHFVLDSIHSGSGGKTPLTAALVAPSDSAVPRDLETLFSAFAGPVTDSKLADPAEKLTPFFNKFELRSHQKQALSWMLWRETLADYQRDLSRSQTSDDVNPLWEKRLMHSKDVYYVNPFEKIASLSPPTPPIPCLGGILADDMGMGKTMMFLSLIAHRKLLQTAPSNVSSARRGSGAARRGRTLVVCPLSLLHQWKHEIEDRFQPGTLSVLVYYGDDRDYGSSLGKSDVVLTTYGIVSSEFEKKATASMLLKTSWDRVILDEAHSIKNRSTTYFRACSSLHATHRWCLTGTPLQNSLSDLFSLLCFLRCEPWSRVAWWQRVIARPFGLGDEEALSRLKVILKPILLRRTKQSRDVHGNNIVELPPKRQELVQLEFVDEERAFYQAVFDRSRAEFNGYVASGTSMSSYIAIFALLLRLRQACDHPFLALGRNSELVANVSGNQTRSSAALFLQRDRDETTTSYFQRISKQLQKVDTTAFPNQENRATGTTLPSSLYVQTVLTQIQEEGIDAQECPVCLDPPTKGVLTPCAHLLCEGCLRESMSNDPENGCPVCRVHVDMAKVYSLAASSDVSAASLDATLERESDSSVFLSSKLRRLIHDLQDIRKEDTRNGTSRPRRKVVVFSQWTQMLEMVVDVLNVHKFGSVMFHGAMNHEARDRVLIKFHSDPAVDVLVISLKAGGVGLNLTCASVVILLDPWWNPGVEDQAIDRVHRLGQTRDVLVKRYVVRDTVEEMILQLQERKEKLARNVLVAAKSADDSATEHLRMEDLLTFFQ